MYQIIGFNCCPFLLLEDLIISQTVQVISNHLDLISVDEYFLSTAPPSRAWSGEKGEELCLKAAVDPATPGTRRSRAPWPGESKSLEQLPNLTCDEDRATQSKGFRGRDGMVAYRWQV